MTKALNIFAVTITTNKKDRKSSKYPFDGLSLDDRNPDFIQRLLPIWEWLYRYYFRVQSDGWHHVPASGKMLVVGSHNGGIAAPDMFMFLYEWFRRYGTERLAYGLMHPTVWQVSPDVASMAVQCGALKAHPKMAIAALRKNAPVLVYPGGAQDVFRPHHLRDRIYFAGRKGFIKLALREEAPIVPIISHGAHDTLIVWPICTNKQSNCTNGGCRGCWASIRWYFRCIWDCLGD